MKKLLVLVGAFALSSEVIAQGDGMMNNNGNSSFSGTEMLLGAILIVLIVAVLVWVSNSRRKG